MWKIIEGTRQLRCNALPDLQGRSFKKRVFRPHSRADQVAESALVALATRAGVAVISEFTSVHSGGFGGLGSTAPGGNPLPGRDLA